MVFAGLFVPDWTKFRGRLGRRSVFPVERAKLALVALQVSDELEFGGFVSVALLAGLHLESEAFGWVEAGVLDEVGIGDGGIAIVGAVVPGVPSSFELIAVVPLEPSFSWLAVEINDARVVAFLFSGSEVSQVEGLAIDGVPLTHSFLDRFGRLLFGLRLDGITLG